MYQQLDWGIFFSWGCITVGIYEGGIFRGNFGIYSPNDVFKISFENGKMNYYKNNGLIYSSTVNPNANTNYYVGVAIKSKSYYMSIPRIGFDARVVSSQLSVQRDQINLKVSSSDYNGNTIVSKINLDAASASISASKINLTGYVTISNLNTPGSVTIDGGNIRANSVSFDKCTGGTLSLGGINNISGLLQVKNATGAVVTKLDKDGITMLQSAIKLNDDNYTDAQYIGSGITFSNNKMVASYCNANYEGMGNEYNSVAEYASDHIDITSDGSLVGYMGKFNVSLAMGGVTTARAYELHLESRDIVNSLTPMSLIASSVRLDKLQGYTNYDKISLGATGSCRIDTSSGNLRLYSSADGSSDNGIRINSNSTIDFRINGVTKFTIDSTGGHNV